MTDEILNSRWQKCLIITPLQYLLVKISLQREKSEWQSQHLQWDLPVPQSHFTALIQ